MKRILQTGWMFLCLAFFISGCDDKPDLEPVGQFHSMPITEVIVEGATVEFDQESREINVVYDAPGDFSSVPVQLVLAEGVRMVDPVSNPFTIDLSGDDKTITVFSYDRTITFKIRASVLIDVAEPIITFEASADGHQAEVTIDHIKRTIAVAFDYNVDLSEVEVVYTLAPEVEAVSPEGKIWDMTDPVTLKLKKYTMETNYNVTASINVDIGEPFVASSFSAVAEGTYPAVVNVNHETQVIDLAFDGYGIDLSDVAVSYELAQDVTVISPQGPTWSLSTTIPTEFILEKKGLQATYTVNTTVDIDVSQPVVTFTASAGGETADAVINHLSRTIYLIFDNAVNLSAVTVDYTLAENVNVVSPAGNIWDLSTASKDNPFEFKLHKLGMDIIYYVYPSNFYVPPFRDKYGAPTGVPDGWERVTTGVSPEMALYRITKWIDDEGADVGPVVAYAMAVPPTTNVVKTVGYGYDNMVQLPAMVQEFPGFDIMISGDGQRQMLIIDGQIVQDINGEDARCQMVDYDGQVRQVGITNRQNEYGEAAWSDGRSKIDENRQGTPFMGQDIFWWDVPDVKFTNIQSAAFVGDGHLAWGARDADEGRLFPYGVFNGASRDKDARIAVGSGAGNVYFVVCEKSDRSEGLSGWNVMEMIRTMGADDGGVSRANPTSVGLYVNGEPVIQNNVNTAVGFGWAIKAK